jgi:hypothetical protein
MHIYIYTFINTYTHTHIRTHIHTYLYTCKGLSSQMTRTISEKDKYLFDLNGYIVIRNVLTVEVTTYVYIYIYIYIHICEHTCL